MAHSEQNLQRKCYELSLAFDIQHNNLKPINEYNDMRTSSAPSFFPRPKPCFLGTCFCAACGAIVKEMNLCENCCAVNYCSRACYDKALPQHQTGNICKLFSNLKEKKEKGVFGAPNPRMYKLAFADPFYIQQVRVIQQQCSSLNLPSYQVEEMILQLFRQVSCLQCFTSPQHATNFTLCGRCNMAGYCSHHKFEFHVLHTDEMCYFNRVYSHYASTVFYNNPSQMVILPENTTYTLHADTCTQFIENGWHGWTMRMLQKASNVIGMGKEDLRSATKICELYNSDVCTLLYVAMKVCDHGARIVPYGCPSIMYKKNMTIHMVDFTGSLRYYDRVKSFEILFHILPHLRRLRLIIMEPPGSTCTIPQFSSYSIFLCKQCRANNKLTDIIYTNQPIEQWLINNGTQSDFKPNFSIWYSVDRLQFNQNSHRVLNAYVDQVNDFRGLPCPVILTFEGKQQHSSIVRELYKSNGNQLLRINGRESYDPMPEVNPFGCELPSADEKIMRGVDVYRNKYFLCLKRQQPYE